MILNLILVISIFCLLGIAWIIVALNTLTDGVNHININIIDLTVSIVEFTKTLSKTVVVK